MDQAGNIGLGYTVGSSTVFPSVFITGRVPSDPAGTMETEQQVVAGSGSQTSPTRWGDYSAMTVDPFRRLHVLVHPGVQQDHWQLQLEYAHC